MRPHISSRVLYSHGSEFWCELRILCTHHLRARRKIPDVPDWIITWQRCGLANGVSQSSNRIYCTINVYMDRFLTNHDLAGPSQPRENRRQLPSRRRWRWCSWRSWVVDRPAGSQPSAYQLASCDLSESGKSESTNVSLASKPPRKISGAILSRCDYFRFSLCISI